MANRDKQHRHPHRKVLPTFLLAALITMFFSAIIIFGIISLPTPSTVIHNSSDLRLVDRRIEFVSWEPRAFLYHNFLSKEECEYLIKVTNSHMRKSAVVDPDIGNNINSEDRTSSGAWLRRGENKVVKAIEKRIAEWTHVPEDHGEDLQVLHYQVGEKYEPHVDYFSNNHYIENGGQRMATVLMYLSDVEEGGETVFPNAKGNHNAIPYWDTLSQCGKQGLSVKPKMGDALLFWSMNPDATLDPLSLHGSCPVIRGNKWSCTKWIRANKHDI